MTSSRPYLLRAIYEWLLDNQLTPYVMVDASYPSVEVPERFVEGGKIILNIEPQAVGGLRMDNDVLSFDARFSGVAHHVYVPVMAVKAIYAFENGRGMVFSEEDEGGDPPPESEVKAPKSSKSKSTSRPKLKIVK